MTNSAIARNEGKVAHLVILPCHAIYKGSGTGENFEDWYMEEFQKEAFDNLSWVKQIQACLDLVYKDQKRKTIVVISGGKTKPVGNISESFSYLNLILQNQECFLGKYIIGKSSEQATETKSKLINSIYLEEYARDSFENLLYSICRFRDITSTYPEKITVVGYKFKKNRFTNYHAKALNYQGDLDYIGIDPEPSYPKDSLQYQKFFDDLDKFEYARALALFEKDPLGITGVLLEKKQKRNPYNTYAPYFGTNLALISYVNQLHKHSYPENEHVLGGELALATEVPFQWY